MKKEEIKQEELQLDNQKFEQQPVQEVKKQRDPNDRKIILCLIAIFFLIVGPIVLTNALKACNKQKEDHYVQEAKINSAFKYIVNDALTKSGIEDTISDIQLVTYTDNYPTDFSFNVCAYNDNKVYYYELEPYAYPTDREIEPENYIGYVVNQFGYDIINEHGSYTVSTYERVSLDISSEHTPNKYVIGKSVTNEQYLFGYYFKDNNFYISNKTQVTEGVDPFSNESVSALANDSLLYKYYQYLNQ